MKGVHQLENITWPVGGEIKMQIWSFIYIPNGAEWKEIFYGDCLSEMYANLVWKCFTYAWHGGFMAWPV